MAAVALKEGSLFVRKKHELADLLKKVEKESPGALEVVSQILSSTDEEKVPMKIKLETARWLLEFQKGLSETISRDELTRQIAEFKANGARSLVADEEKPSAPRLDMTTIQKI